MASWSHSLALFATITLSLISIVQAEYKRCGIWDCYGTGVYCCAGNCCFAVYTRWWFWSVWAFGIAIIISIVVVCCRSRRRRMASGVVVRQAQPVYGAATSYAYTGPAYPAPGTGYNQPYTAPPTTAPPTAPAYQEKPPAYNP